MSDTLLWFIVVISIVLGAFYSGSETAFFAADRVRLRHLSEKGDARGRHVLEFLAAPEYFLSAVLVGTNLSVTACTTAFTAIATRHFGDSGPTVATVVLVPTILLFSEIVPKGVFLYYANRSALASVEPLRLFTKILFPVVKAFSVLADALTRFLPTNPDSNRINMTMEELLFHLGDSREAGLIAAETTSLAERALELRDLAVGEVITPLDRVVMVDADAPSSTYAEIFAREGFSRFPLFRGTRDNIVGVMSVHEFMTSPDVDKLRDGLRRPYSVPMQTPIADVLFVMREEGRHMAVVTDADGGVVGVTTMEDILERMVGAIKDEFH